VARDSFRANESVGAPGDAIDWRAPLDRFLESSPRVYLLAGASILLFALGIFVDALFRTQLDFRVYLNGARHLFDGSIYSTRISMVPHLAFTYTPFAGLFFWPLTLFPFRAAQLIWLAISIASLVSFLALSIWAVRPDLDRRRLWLAAAILLGPMFFFEPIQANFGFGQVNIVLGFMVLADLLVDIRVGPTRVPRGVLIGIAAAVKLVPLVFVAYLFVTRQIRSALVASASFAACTLIALACNPHVSWLYWGKYAFDPKRIGGMFYLSNQSLRGSLDRITHTLIPAGPASALAFVVLIAGLALALWAHRASSSYLGVLVTATTGMLVSPITWTHHIVWSIPILVWLALARDRPVGGQWWALAAAIVLWVSPVWRVSAVVHDEIHENVFESLAANSFFLLMVTFLVGVAAMLTARRRRTVRTAPKARVHYGSTSP